MAVYQVCQLPHMLRATSARPPCSHSVPWNEAERRPELGYTQRPCVSWPVRVQPVWPWATCWPLGQVLEQTDVTQGPFPLGAHGLCREEGLLSVCCPFRTGVHSGLAGEAPRCVLAWARLPESS